MKYKSLIAFLCIILSSPSALAAPKYTVDDAYDAQAVLQQYLDYWEAGNISKLEFLLHNQFVSAAGEKKAAYLQRLKKEAANMAGRQIKHQWKGSKANGELFQVNYFLDYTEQFKKYKGQKFFHSCQNVTLQMLKFKDGKLYIVKEQAKAAKCP